MKWTKEQINKGINLIDFFMYGYESKIYNDYCNDWNLIQPVIEKLEQKGCLIEQTWCLGYRCHIFHSIGKRKESINIAEGINGGDSPLLATFKAVVTFLEKYNKIC